MDLSWGLEQQFFHKYAEGRRVQNSIWSLKNIEGDLIEDTDLLQNEAVIHLQAYY